MKIGYPNNPLTFREYSAGTTPVLSVRSSLFLFRRFCQEHVSNARLTNDFWHYQLASSMGNVIILPLSRQRVAWYSFNGNQQQSRRGTMRYYPQKVGTDPSRGCGTSH